MVKTAPKKKQAKTVDKTIVQKKASAKKNITAKPQQLAYKVPECSLHYGAALANPFDTPAGVCIPAELLPLPSQKIKTFVRGRFAVGTNGIGWISVTPNLANDAATVQYTTATSAGTSGTALSSFTNLGQSVGGQLPYATANLTAKQVGGRIAACGVRVFYAGQALQRGGNVICFEDPDGSDMRGGNFDTISSSTYADCVRLGMVDREWDAAVCYSGPISPNNVEFQNITTPLGAGIFGMVLNGTAGDAYEFEVFQHTEYIGTGAAGKTASHSDPQTCAKVLQAAKAITADGPLCPDKEPTLWEKFKSGLVETLPKLITMGVGIARAFSGDPTSAPMILGSFSQMLPAPKPQLRLGWRDNQN